MNKMVYMVATLLLASCSSPEKQQTIENLPGKSEEKVAESLPPGKEGGNRRCYRRDCPGQSGFFQWDTYHSAPEFCIRHAGHGRSGEGSHSIARNLCA